MVAAGPTWTGTGFGTVSAAPYLFGGNPTISGQPGTILPRPQDVTGKEYSSFQDRDASNNLDPGQTVAWDGNVSNPGPAGVRNGLDFSNLWAGFPTQGEIDALAHHRDILADALLEDRSFLLFSVGNGTAPLGSGTIATSESQTIGRAGDISYERPGGAGKGVWAVGNIDIDPMNPPQDVDALEIWGGEPPNFDADLFSLQDDAATTVSIYTQSGSSYLSHSVVATAVGSLLGTLPNGLDMDDIDLDALITWDQTTPDRFESGDMLIFSIRQLVTPDAVYATGSEIFTLTGTAAAPQVGFLTHGGHVWDRNYALAAMRDAGSNRLLDIDALEAASIPEPTGLTGVFIGLLASVPVWRRNRA